MLVSRFVLFLRIALLGVSCSAVAAGLSSEDQIGIIAEANGVTVPKGNVNAAARPDNDQGPLDQSARIDGLKLLLSPSDQQASDLERLLEDQRNPSSENYHRWLSPEEYGQRFGVSDDDLARVTLWLQSQGFAIGQVARARNWIAFSGTAGQIAGAFRTELHHYNVGGERHFANSSEPSIPASLARVIGGIHGLDDFRPKPSFRELRSSPEFDVGTALHYIGPDDLATIYDVQALYSIGFDGSGQKIAIAGQTDISLSDIRAFRSMFNLPAKDPELVLTGPDPGTRPPDQIEASLDIEWAGAIARNATVVYVYSGNVFESLQYVIDQKLAPVVSMSYGSCENGASLTYRTLAQQANAEGITWLNSSGDSGAAGCDYGGLMATQGPATTFPADIPEVTAVGGTEFNEGTGIYWSNQNSTGLSSALSYIPEKAWNDTPLGYGIASGGGGASALYQKPSWQAGPGVPNDGARDVPDVSLTASGDHDGYVIFSSGGMVVVQGTSASSPAFAGIVTILNQYLVAQGTLSEPGLGNINPSLYSLAAKTSGVFHDITSGSNIVPCAAGSKGCGTGSFGYNAGPGYDMATGLGSVDAYNLVTRWNDPGAAEAAQTVFGEGRPLLRPRPRH